VRQVLKHVWHTTHEYMTHWMVAGAILAATGAAPDHWLAHAFQKLHLPADALHLWVANIDLRVVLAALGLLLIGGDIGWRLLRARTPSPALMRNGAAVTTDAIAANTGAPPLPGKPKQAVAGVFHPSEPPSIMILPFKNLSGNEDQKALVDGFRLAIQSALVKLPGMFLINAPAVEHYRHTDVSPSRAGNEFGIRYVLDGAVQFAGDRVRVTIQLTDAPAGKITWAERYDRVVDDIFEIQDEITTEVAVALDIKLIIGDCGLVWWAGLPTRNARELVLRGISHMYMGTESGNAEAQRIFAQLTEILPDSPQALALSAYTNWVSVMRGWSKDPAQSIARATAQAQKAIERGDPDGFARVVLASVRLFERRHDEALKLSEGAVSIRHSCPTSKAVYANVLHFIGDHVQAIENVKRALDHARIYPPWMAALLAASYRDIGQMAQSIGIANECVRADPENLDGYVLLCAAHSLSNSAGVAEKVAGEIMRIHPSFRISAYLETQPYKDKKPLENIAGALRQAGLPE
jgi:adenylate cyclase